MEEIVNRYYFSTINSFVYFGAAILLVLIGIRRFSEVIDDNIVIAGIAFEALMLILMFIVMLFTPNQDTVELTTNDEEPSDDLITEIGEIGHDLAAVVMQLEQLGSSIEDMINKQNDILKTVENIAQTNADAVSPNPQMLETMRETNIILKEFKDTVQSFNSAAEELKKEEIELAVRREVERIIVDKVSKS